MDLLTLLKPQMSKQQSQQVWSTDNGKHFSSATCDQMIFHTKLHIFCSRIVYLKPQANLKQLKRGCTRDCSSIIFFTFCKGQPQMSFIFINVNFCAYYNQSTRQRMHASYLSLIIFTILQVFVTLVKKYSFCIQLFHHHQLLRVLRSRGPHTAYKKSVKH